MCYLCAARRPNDVLAAFDSHNELPSNDAIGVTRLPSGGELSQIAQYLQTGFWQAQGEEARKFNVPTGGTIVVNLNALSSAEKYVARAALEAWNDATGLKFRQAATGETADIVFRNSGNGAYSYSHLQGEVINRSVVNVEDDWDVRPISLNSYWLQTYIHEIGHALGLGHAGNYNGDANYRTDHRFRMDSWQTSVMSYFSQEDNPNTRASFAFLATIMPADLLTIRALYGTTSTTRTGNTDYGAHSNVDGYLGALMGALFDGERGLSRVFTGNPQAFMIIDDGGHDQLSAAGLSRAVRIDLRPGHSSSFFGLKGNVLIAPGTLIEDAIGGREADQLLGNGGANRLVGGYGNDRLFGMAGNDRLIGATGHDRLNGGAGDDMLIGGVGEDRFIFNSGQDVVRDFANNRDTLVIDNALWGGGPMSVTRLLNRFGEVTDEGIALRFSPSAVLLIEDVTRLATLSNDILIV